MVQRVQAKEKIILICLVSTLMIGGCAIFKDQRAKFLVAQKVYSATVDALIEMHQAGKLDKADTNRVTKLINAGEVMLDEWAIAIEQGKDTSRWQEAFSIVLDGMIEYAKKGAE